MVLGITASPTWSVCPVEVKVEVAAICVTLIWGVKLLVESPWIILIIISKELIEMILIIIIKIMILLIILMIIQIILRRVSIN